MAGSWNRIAGRRNEGRGRDYSKGARSPQDIEHDYGYISQQRPVYGRRYSLWGRDNDFDHFYGPPHSYTDEAFDHYGPLYDLTGGASQFHLSAPLAWKPGRYTGRGPQGYRRPDDRILDDVMDWLTRHGDLDATGINGTVSDGVVVLDGTVEDHDQKRMANALAQAVLGVTEVRNDLRVARPEASGWQGTDEERGFTSGLTYS